MIIVVAQIETSDEILYQIDGPISDYVQAANLIGSALGIPESQIKFFNIDQLYGPELDIETIKSKDLKSYFKEMKKEVDKYRKEKERYLREVEEKLSKID